VGYRPQSTLKWTDLPFPLSAGQPAERLRVREPQFDLQLPLIMFLDRLAVIHSWAGLLLHQMSRPVADTLMYQSFAGTPSEYPILRQNGWLLTFYLPHDGEHAVVTCPDRVHVDGILSDPVIAAGKLP
jgi:hypothetical protein